MLYTSTSNAGILESLISPGPVVQSHAKFESDCGQCHSVFQKQRQNDLCLVCHEDVATDIRRRRGFHSAIPDISGTECKHCHTDHKGRDADIVRLDPETFDHGMTEFALNGAHPGVACASCHESGKQYRDAPSQCVDCHKADEPHKGRLGKKCASCHDENTWQSTTFDHDKTSFALRGEHRETRCEQCHINERYENTPAACIACHGLNDVHAGRYGERCEMCHSPAEWTNSTFDHDTKTDFPLAGKHRVIRCDACHSGDFHGDTEGRTCFSCHKADDEHRGRNGQECGQCHSPKGWMKLGFDHGKDTKFPLRGLHAKLTCESCHTGHVFDDKLETTCYACHEFDDVHKGQEGKNCGNCHNEQAWGAEVFFDHDLTAFPLIGLHAVTPCEECHVSAAYKDTSLACADCHKSDDEHRERLGPRCGLCHNPNGWALWAFDHDKQTDYVLDGAHKGLDCVACHRVPVKKEISLSTTCGRCHKQDDIHRGSFGGNCDRCHGTERFDLIRLR